MQTKDECRTSSFALSLCHFIYALKYSFLSNQLFYLAFRQHSMIAILENFHKIDKKFVKLNMKFNYYRLRFFCLCTIIFSLIVATIIFVSLIYLANTAEDVITGSGSIMLILFPLKYGVGVTLGFYIIIYIKYYALNKKLSSISYNKEWRIVDNILESCVVIHLELYRLTKLIGKLYNVTILGNMVLFFVTLLQYSLTYLGLNETRRQLYGFLCVFDLIAILMLGVTVDVVKSEVCLNISYGEFVLNV